MSGPRQVPEPPASTRGGCISGATPPAEVGDEAAARNDARLQGAWRAWLSSLATDADAVAAAAHLYAELPPEARDAWLDALAEDAPKLEVPGVAIYGPLLAVENDPARRLRIGEGAGVALAPMSEVLRALLGTAAGGARAAVLVIRLYLDFVRVLMCRFERDRGFRWVKQDVIVHLDDAPLPGDQLEGIELYASSAEAVVDELSHAVLAHRRSGRELPQLLRDCAELFGPSVLRAT